MRSRKQKKLSIKSSKKKQKKLLIDLMKEDQKYNMYEKPQKFNERQLQRIQ